MSIKALDALFASSGDFKIEVFVIDNASKDHSVELLKQHYPQVTLIENQQNVGFGRANNQAQYLVTGDYVLLLNTDAFVAKDTLQKTTAFMQTHPNYGILGARLLGRDGMQQPSCRFFPTPFNLFADRTGLNQVFPSIKVVDDPGCDFSQTQDCDWVPGCYYLMRKQVVDTVGLFDPLYFLYCEEVDHCFAVKKAGWDIVYFADAPVVHLGGESAKSLGTISAVSRQVPVLQIESELLYFRKNHGLLGVLMHLVLSNLADMVQLVKDVMRLRPLPKILFNIKRIITCWKQFFATRCGTLATR